MSIKFVEMTACYSARADSIWIKDSAGRVVRLAGKS